MMFMFFSIFMITISLIFLNMIHPLSMGLILLLQTLNMCIMIGMMSKSFWFSFILFLILLGGMLVLFMYVVSLAPNEKFTLFKKLFFYILMYLMMTSIIYLLVDKMKIQLMFNNKEMILMNNLLSFLPENSLSLNKLYNSPTYIMTMILIIYLLMVLITTVYITKAFFGPLRMMNNKIK
nr:NADH dehydrogenase subunit 6 [Melanagromyza aenea]